MCLLVAIHRHHPAAPLVVAANRDEWLARPANPFGILSASAPTILGGRDQVAGGTWLATNEHGVIAGLTNRPMPAGRDESKRSRGELPLIAAREKDATAAVAALRVLRPADFNPCWILVGDRESLVYVDMTGESPHIEKLPPGIYVLENRPLHADSPKADCIRDALAGHACWRGADLVANLATVLASHAVPDAAHTRKASESWRPLATEAACVHAGPYGTRSATIVVVGADGAPALHVAGGPPCTHPFEDMSYCWGITRDAKPPVSGA